MSDGKQRTYVLDNRTVDWIDEFADEQGVDKSQVVDRAIKVYAAKLTSGDISDPFWGGNIDSKFRRMR